MKQKPETETQKIARLRALRLAQKPVPESTNIPNPTSIWKLTDVLSFGKHRGCTIAHIIESDPSYITYALENFPDFELDPAAEAEYNAAVSDPRPKVRSR